MADIWNDLVAAHADIVLSGHNHDYERFEPIGVTPSPGTVTGSTTTGTPNFQEPKLDPAGIREWVVGTGGKNHYGFGTQPAMKGEVVRDSSTYGVLKLTLHPTSYDWQFVNDPGSGTFTDSGTGSCLTEVWQSPAVGGVPSPTAVIRGPHTGRDMRSPTRMARTTEPVRDSCAERLTPDPRARGPRGARIATRMSRE